MSTQSNDVMLIESLLGIHQQLGEIKGKLDALSGADDQKTKRLDSHSTRLDSIEKFKNKIIGWAAGISAVVSVLVSSASTSAGNLVDTISNALGFN